MRCSFQCALNFLLNEIAFLLALNCRMFNCTFTPYFVHFIVWHCITIAIFDSIRCDSMRFDSICITCSHILVMWKLLWFSIRLLLCLSFNSYLIIYFSSFSTFFWHHTHFEPIFPLYFVIATFSLFLLCSFSKVNLVVRALENNNKIWSAWILVSESECVCVRAAKIDFNGDWELCQSIDDDGTKDSNKSEKTTCTKNVYFCEWKSNIIIESW